MKIPPGYITQARADHLTAELWRGIDEIVAGISKRFRARSESATTREQCLAILREECDAADLEIQRWHQQLREQLYAQEH